MPGPVTDEELAQLESRLAELLSEHRDLDTAIARLSDQASTDQLHLQRLKKRKLRLKDEISAVERRMIPDIIA